MMFAELVINKDVVRGIAVPNYSNATKEQSAMVFITNRYYRIYFSIIEKAKTRTLPKNTYKERHHIIPRSLGGDDSPENLVDLTAREHFICHRLLVRMTELRNKSKMSYAVWCMANMGQNISEYKITSRVFEHIRISVAQANGESRCGANHPMFGKQGYWHGKEGPNKGKKHTQEHKDRIANTLRGRKNKPHTEETKRKISEQRTGSNNPNYGKPRTNQTKENIGNALRGKPKAKHKCDHCHIETSMTNIIRWHNNNCKHKGK